MNTDEQEKIKFDIIDKTDEYFRHPADLQLQWEIVKEIRELAKQLEVPALED